MYVDWRREGDARWYSIALRESIQMGPDPAQLI